MRVRSIDWLAQILLAALALNCPAFSGDDAGLFNYLNNVDGAPLFYFKSGYVHVLPQLVSYAVSGLPFVAQAAAYRIVPLIAMLCLYRQLRRLLSLFGDATDASMWSLAIVLTLRVVEPLLFGELSYVTWSAFLAAFVCVIRIHCTSEGYSILEFIGVLLGALSLPHGVLLVPVWLAHAALGRAARRWQDAALAAVVTASSAMTFAFSIEQSAAPLGAAAALAMFAAGFRQEKLANLIVVVSVIVLSWSAARAALHPWRPLRGAGPAARGSACWLGLGSVALYVNSDRFAMHGGSFFQRCTPPVLAAALIVLAMHLLTLGVARARTALAGGAVGAAAALVIVLLSTQLRGPLETSLMRYRFLSVAAEFRQHCRDGEAMTFDATDSSPVVLCRPKQLPVGYYELRNVPPTIGAAAGPFDDAPGIFVYQPLW